MPRRLPWEVGKPTQKLTPARPPPPPTADHQQEQHNRSPSPPDLFDSDLNPLPTTTTTPPNPKSPSKPLHPRGLARTPSTSPPPAPPPTEYMIPEDDDWMMVEDEFHATAKQYTQHIHHAEYVRLKQRAQRRGQEAFADIVRPVDGRTEQSVEVQMQARAEANGRWISGALRGVGGDGEGESEEDEAQMDPQLTGLMANSQAQGENLAALVRPKVNTRAAAGFANSPSKARHVDVLGEDKESAVRRAIFEDEEDEEDESDDLDAVRSKPFKKSTKPSTPIKKEKAPARDSDRAPQFSSSIFKKYAAGIPIKQEKSPSLDKRPEISSSPPVPTSDYRAGTTSKRHNSTSSIEEVAEPSSYTAPSATQSNYMGKRRAAREKERLKAKRTTKEIDEIPTFL